MLQLLGRPAVCSKCHREDWCGLASTTNGMCRRSCADATAMLPCVALKVMRANFEHLLKSATAAGVFIQASGAPKLGGYGATHTLLSVARVARYETGRRIAAMGMPWTTRKRLEVTCPCPTTPAHSGLAHTHALGRVLIIPADLQVHTLRRLPARVWLRPGPLT